METYQEIEQLKKDCDGLVKKNILLKKNIEKKKKELKKLDLENNKINNKVEQQRKNINKFLRDIERWANK